MFRLIRPQTLIFLPVRMIFAAAGYGFAGSNGVPESGAGDGTGPSRGQWGHFGTATHGGAVPPFHQVLSMGSLLHWRRALSSAFVAVASLAAWAAFAPAPLGGQASYIIVAGARAGAGRRRGGPVGGR